MDDLYDFFVGGLGTDAVTHLVGSEHLCEPLAAGHFLPSLCEEVDEALLGTDAALLRESEGLCEFRALVIS